MAQDNISPYYIDEDLLSPSIPPNPQSNPGAQALDVSYLYTHTDIGITGVNPPSWTHGVPSSCNWFPPCSFSMGLNTSDFAIPSQPYGFFSFISPASIVVGAPFSVLASYRTIYINEPTFLNLPIPPLDGVTGIQPAVPHQSWDVNFSSQGYCPPELGTEALDVRLDIGNTATESPVATLRSLDEISPTTLDGISLTPRSLDEMSPTPSDEMSPTPSDEMSPTPRSLDEISPIQFFDGISSDWHGRIQAPEHIDLTGDDESDSHRSGLYTSEPHTESKMIDGIRETSTPWDSPLQCIQPRNAQKRERDAVDDVHSSSPLGNNQKRRCMRNSPRRPAKDNELVLDVRTISQTNDNGQGVESELKSGRWTFPIYEDDITAISFAVNSGNWTNLTFKRSEKPGWWRGYDVDGFYEIYLSDSDLTTLIESPKETRYPKYHFVET